MHFLGVVFVDAAIEGNEPDGLGESSLSVTVGGASLLRFVELSSRCGRDGGGVIIDANSLFLSSYRCSISNSSENSELLDCTICVLRTFKFLFKDIVLLSMSKRPLVDATPEWPALPIDRQQFEFE